MSLAGLDTRAGHFRSPRYLAGYIPSGGNEMSSHKNGKPLSMDDSDFHGVRTVAQEFGRLLADMEIDLISGYCYRTTDAFSELPDCERQDLFHLLQHEVLLA